MNLVEINNVSKTFGSIKAVREVSFTLGEGEVMGLLGANGAGKTTLIRMICSLLPPDSGSVWTDGRPGYMCQTFSLVEELSVHENIRYYGTLMGLSREELSQREEEITERLNLTQYRKTPVRALSSGYRQGLSFSVAVIADPKVLILDEPTSGLDAVARRNMWKMIHERASMGTGIIVSTHYLDEAYYCSSLSLLREGQLIARGTPKEVAPDENALLKYFR